MLQNLEDVSIATTEWLWQDRVPFGELTSLEGDPASNKGTLTVDVAARLSVGACMPGTKKAVKPARSLFFLREDSVERTLLPRLHAAGGDDSMVAAVTAPVYLPRDLAEVARYAERANPRLLVFDPLPSFIEKSMLIDTAVRKALDPLADLAKQTGIAIILVRHLTKSKGRRAMYAGSGSIGVMAACRSALMMGAPPDDEDMRVLAPVKSMGQVPSSLLAEPVAVTVSIVGLVAGLARVKGRAPAVRLEWRGFSRYTAADLLAGKGESKLNKAVDLIKTLLARGPQKANDIKAAAHQEGMGGRTVDRARELLGITPKKKGIGPGSYWVWEMSR
jgi:hypothetical protein